MSTDIEYCRIVHEKEKIMKLICKSLIKSFFRKLLIETKEKYKLTNERLEEKLDIDPRSLADLFNGKSAMSLFTCILFLVLFFTDEQILSFVAKARKLLISSDDNAA